MPQIQPTSVDATMFAQVEPRWGSGTDAAGHPILYAAKVVGLTQERPRKQKPGTVLAKLTLRIPSGAFLPLAPEAVIVIPADMVTTEPLEVLAEDARDAE